MGVRRGLGGVEYKVNRVPQSGARERSGACRTDWRDAQAVRDRHRIRKRARLL